MNCKLRCYVDRMQVAEMAVIVIPPEAFASFLVDMSAPNKSDENHQSYVSWLRRFRLKSEQLSKYIFVQWPLRRSLVD